MQAGNALTSDGQPQPRLVLRWPDRGQPDTVVENLDMQGFAIRTLDVRLTELTD